MRLKSSRGCLGSGEPIQARGSTVRLVVPRDPQVTRELGPISGKDELLSAEENLQDHGYVTLADIQLMRGTYTISPAGLLDGGLPEPSEAAQNLVEEPEREPRPATRGAQASTKRPWWRRMIGGERSEVVAA